MRLNEDKYEYQDTMKCTKQEFRDRENNTKLYTGLATNYFVTYVQSSNLRHAKTLVLIGYPTNCKDLKLGIPHPKTIFEGYHTFNEQEVFLTCTQHFNLDLQI
jgi:hypothetical protein